MNLTANTGGFHHVYYETRADRWALRASDGTTVRGTAAPSEGRRPRVLGRDSGREAPSVGGGRDRTLLS